MKRILTTAIGGVALLAGPALAADLPSRKEPPVAPVVYAPVFTWTGFYVGANAGGAWASRGSNNAWFPYGFANGNGLLTPGIGAGLGGSFLPFVNYANVNTIYNNSNGNNGGFTGGIQAGYNYQMGAFVVGLEADINYLGTHRNNVPIAGTTYYGDPFGSYRFQDAYYAGLVPRSVQPMP